MACPLTAGAACFRTMLWLPGFTGGQSWDVFMAASHPSTHNQKGPNMLYTLAVILLILWLLGMVGSYTLGGLIHILLVVALVMIVVNLVTGRRAL
jgi:hypothetical protein